MWVQVRLMKNSILQSQVIWKQNKFVIILLFKYKLANPSIYSVSFKRIIYFFFCLLLKYREYFYNILKTLSRQWYSFVRTLEIQILKLCHMNFQQRFLVLLLYQVTLSYKSGDSRKLGLQGRKKYKSEQRPIIYNPVRAKQKIVNIVCC